MPDKTLPKPPARRLPTWLVWLGVPVLLMAGCCIRQEYAYRQSAQYKLDQIVTSGRTGFQLHEILGRDWRVVCLMPYSYSVNYGTSDFHRWLEGVLQRRVSEREYLGLGINDYKAVTLYYTPRRYDGEGWWNHLYQLDLEGMHQQPWQT